MPVLLAAIVRSVALNPLQWFTWRKPDGVTLDPDYEREIVRTALLARRADDPETAWFVAHYARDRLRLSWLYVTATVLFTAQLVWAAVVGSFKWWSLAIVVLILWSPVVPVRVAPGASTERTGREGATGTRRG
jgi:hypothetical protein